MTTTASTASLSGSSTTSSATSSTASSATSSAASSTTSSAASSTPASSLRTKALVAAAILAAFSAYSLWVIAGHGYTGFLSLASREPWGMQMLLDLVLACSFAIGWMRADARKHSIPTWPFIVATLFLGSVGLLGYVVWRGVTRRPGT